MSDSSLSKVYVGVGSNLGDRKASIISAIISIGALDQTIVTKVSPIYETEPVGGPPQDLYLNGAIEVLTSLDPYQLLNGLLSIEKQLGRTRKGKNLPRTIDLDILLYDDIILEGEDIMVPHPRMSEREFVTIPLKDIRT